MKDPIPGGLHSSVVYKFTSAGCNAFYVGETCFTLWRQCCPVVRVLGLHAAEPGSNPVLTSGLDLFPVVPDSIPPRFVNSQLVASCHWGFLIMFLLSLNCYFHLVNSGVPVN